MENRLIVLALGTFAIGTDSFVVAGILPDVARSLGIGIGAAGQLITVYAAAYAVLTPIMAALTARWPRRRVLLCGLVVFVFGNLATALSPGLALVLASRAVAGLGAAMFTPAASASAAALVPPERRGRALAMVIAGLSAATALGAPTGTVIGTLGSWRLTMWFVAALGALAALGVAALLPRIPGPPPLGLRARLAPLGDARVAATLATTLLVFGGLFFVYSYINLVLDRATGGDGTVLAALLAVWGVAATIGNLVSGRLTDRFGNRPVINGAIVILAADFVLLPWAGATLHGAVIVLVVWGLCGWGLLAPQQHRLIAIAPAIAPIVLALSGAAVYAGAAAASAIGAIALRALDAHRLGLFSAAVILAGLIAAETAQALIRRRRSGTASAAVSQVAARN